MYKWATFLRTWNIVSQLLCCCSLSHIWVCDPIDCSMPGLPVPHYLPECAQTYVHWVNDSIHPSHPLLSPSPLPSVFPSIRVFSRVSSSYQVAKVLELQLQDQSFQWLFRIDEFDLLTVHGTLRSRLQHHSSKASILRHSAFFMVQLLHPYMTSFDHMDVCQQSDVSAF